MSKNEQIPGVRWRADRQKWQATIAIGYDPQINLGLWKSKDDAIAVRKKAEELRAKGITDKSDYIVLRPKRACVMEVNPTKEELYESMLTLNRAGLIEKYKTTEWKIKDLISDYGLSYRQQRIDQYPVALTPEQKDVVIGTLLGDASIRKSGPYRFAQGKDHCEYAHYIAAAMQPFYQYKLAKQYTTSEGSIAYGIVTTTHPIFKSLRKEWYIWSDEKEKGIKIIPQSLTLNQRRVVHWALDDGSNDPKHRNFKFCTHCFTEDEVERLRVAIEATTGFGFRISKDRANDKTVYILFVRNPFYFDFLDYLKPFISQFDCMKHKVDISKAPIPDRTYSPKLDAHIAKEIRIQYFLNNMTISQLARDNSVSFPTIKRIIQNKRYADDAFYSLIKVKNTNQN